MGTDKFIWVVRAYDATRDFKLEVYVVAPTASKAVSMALKHGSLGPLDGYTVGVFGKMLPNRLVQVADRNHG